MAASIVGNVFGSIIVIIIVLIVAYFVIRSAVLHALASHYKTVRYYERTGLWAKGYQGNDEPKKID